MEANPLIRHPTGIIFSLTARHLALSSKQTIGCSAMQLINAESGAKWRIRTTHCSNWSTSH